MNFRISIILFASLLLANLGKVAQAAEVKMLFSFALPPYVIAEAPNQPASGFELEIIRAALDSKGHTIKPIFVAMGAIPNMLKAAQADGGQRGSPDLKDGEGFFYADEPSVTYQDVAITLQKNNLAINSVADIKGKSVVGFQGASHFLGPEFAQAVKGSNAYAETSDEKRRIKQLYANGVQVYVGDINVFKYYKIGVKDLDTNLPINIHKVFVPSNQKFNNPVFRDKQIRDDFNAGLKQLKANGQYKQIIKKYIND
ncbi:MAG: ABC transporter substrate-binding protein [Burkholderiales bacterium]|nr:ABC transporter substrate-binding protein [Burkholderiales bacterium]